jgi:hypothetical protein
VKLPGFSVDREEDHRAALMAGMELVEQVRRRKCHCVHH